MLRGLLNFILKPIANPSVEALYRACVRQARLPAFYRDWHVPDTVDGRFDLLILHVLLVIQRLHDHPDQTQQLFDILFADMDKNLREMGVSDVSIAKKMKPMLAAFYGRAKIYERGLAINDEALGEALHRNIFARSEIDHTQELVIYVRRAHAELATQNTDDLLNGQIVFPKVIDDE